MPFLSGKLHDIPHNEEIAAKPFSFDERQLLFESSFYLIGYPAVSHRSPLVTEPPEIGARRLTWGKGEVRETIGRKIELERAGFGNRKGAADRLGGKSGQKAHLLVVLQVIFRIGTAEAGGTVEAHPVPDADEDIMELVAGPLPVMDIVGGDRWNAGLFCKVHEPPAKRPVLRVQVVLHLKIETAGGEDGHVSPGCLLCLLPLPLKEQARNLPLFAAGKTNEAAAQLRDMGKRETGVALRAGKLGLRHETGQVAVAPRIFYEQGDMAGVIQGQLGPHNRFDAGSPRRPAKPGHPVKAVVVGEGEGRHAPGTGRLHKLSGEARPVQEREV